LVEKIGELWADGSLKVVNEHMASAVIRSFLGDMIRASASKPNAPGIVVTTPAGHLHELGALLLAVAASDAGWNTLYLGPNLPAEEIAAAVEQSGARLVALSIVHPAEEPRLHWELTKLRQLLSEDVLLIVGGSAAAAYRATLEKIQATYLEDITSFRKQLEKFRVGDARFES
jgi:methanogenic corrinoid protein MtbC1